MLGSEIRIYLAGPDVFLPDASQIAATKKTLCAQYGFTGVFPLDADLDITGMSPHEAAYAISGANENLIRACQVLIANMTPFRGPSADVGTAYEMGFARALGLKVFAYTNDPRSFRVRTVAAAGEGGEGTDAEGLTIEPWGLMDNLMLPGGVVASGGTVFVGHPASDVAFTDLAAFELCLKAIRRG